MPPATTIKEFIRAVRDRKSAIALQLDHCIKKANDPTYPHYEAGYRARINTLIAAWTPPDPFPKGLADELGLTQRDRDHIDHWQQYASTAPGADPAVPVLQGIRDAAFDATLPPPASRDMEFFWEIEAGAGTASRNDVDKPAAGKITVTFLTPRQKVKKRGLTHGEIDVDI